MRTARELGDGESVQSVENAFTVLRELASGTADRSAPDLARSTGLSRPAVYRLLRAMQRSLIVAYDPVAGRFSLGVGLRELALSDRWHATLRRLALPEMQRLREATGETVSLYVPLNDVENVCIETLTSPSGIRHEEHVGSVFGLFRGATAAVFLAERARRDGDESIAAMLNAVSSSALPPDGIPGVLARMHEGRDGFASTSGERVPGCAAIAMPIRSGAAAPVVAAINLSGPRERFGEPQMSAWSDLVREAAGRIGGLLGRSPGQSQTAR